jgi:hypothetical protein
MPTYALELLRDGGSEPRLWDSGLLELALDDEFELDGERWVVVVRESVVLDTPDGVEVVDKLTCRPA